MKIDEPYSPNYALNDSSYKSDTHSRSLKIPAHIMEPTVFKLTKTNVCIILVEGEEG